MAAHIVSPKGAFRSCRTVTIKKIEVTVQPKAELLQIEEKQRVILL